MNPHGSVSTNEIFIVFGQKYNSADMAAIAALNEIMATSRGVNREFCGRIYMNMDGTFSYTRPIQGGKDWCNPGSHPKGTNLAGSYHTHGRYDPGYAANQFSPGDQRSARRDGVPEYVGIPGHRIGVQGNIIKKYTPSGPSSRRSDFKILQGPTTLPKESAPR